MVGRRKPLHIVNPDDDPYLRHLERQRRQDAQARDFARPVPLETPPQSAPPPPKPQPPVRNEPVRIPEPLRKTEGYLKVPNELLDDILPTLRPAEALVLLRLFRLSAGYGREVCTVSIGKLASKCGQKPTATRAALKVLEGRGLVVRAGDDLGNPARDMRGVTFRIPLAANPSAKRTPSDSEPNKLNALKNKNIKGAVCDLCKGQSGMYYPSGVVGQGPVARCTHGQGD